MWHNISLRNIFDESVYLQNILSARTTAINLSRVSINRILNASHAHINDIFSKRNFQKHAWSVKK